VNEIAEHFASLLSGSVDSFDGISGHESNDSGHQLFSQATWLSSQYQLNGALGNDSLK
jgi:hypothetical protein